MRFPNGDEKLLATRDLFVRWNRPIEDPTPFLAHWFNDTPSFADARSGYVEAMVTQRAACQGMSALISSLINLEAHQVEVVRRVLQDPVQRYLLADEVGLGKTVEAGVLIRQYVLDDPDHHNVIILVPEVLVQQWRDELHRRFLLGVYLGSSVKVVSTSDISSIAETLLEAGMLVLDEAHHLSRNPALYDLVLRAARSVARLLLLSATPVLRNERGFLEMMHLLDPVVFSLTEEDAFRRKIAHRQVLAETVAGLVPENLLQMEHSLDVLADCFAADHLLMSRIAVLRAVIADLPDETDPAFQAALSGVRAHLSETYRLDRRILRNRRTAVLDLTP